ncbi:DUF2019 domain-containing protein [Consotaella salsifontis]|uniref:DUF2019 domain-containing protein n=1 Tax=Consotaella salsifontis TaxID=1365950 RepID=A0A1T4SR38_9HYPH|nr:DUF2019 domain-containing protein [Consotaella salsifontis]SKA30724.1 protein of unknown function [Consotaella salsifontis]
MRFLNTAKATTEELVDYFAELGLSREQAEIMSDQAELNRAIRRRFDVVAELKSRKGDARRLLMRHFGHKSTWVQLNAAKATLALFPEAARLKLSELAEWEAGPVRAGAREFLEAFDNGSYRPE